MKVLKPFHDSQDNMHTYGPEHERAYPRKGLIPTPERIDALVKGGFIEDNPEPTPTPEPLPEPPQDEPEQHPEAQEQPESDSPRRRYRR